MDTVHPDAPPIPPRGGLVNLTQLARLEGVTKAAVSKTVAKLTARRLIETQRGEGREVLVDPAAYKKAKARSADPARALALPPAAGGAAPPDRADVYQDAKARQAEADANRAVLRLAREAGKLCSVEQATAKTVDLFTAVRERLQALPAKVAPRLLNQADRRAVQLELRRAIDDVLEKLAAKIEAGADLIDDEDDDTAPAGEENDGDEE